MSDDDSAHGTGDPDFDGEDPDALTTNSREPAPDDRNSTDGGAYGAFTVTNDGISEGAR